MILCGDSLDVMKAFEDDSVDSLVTDPPAGISFMGNAWDHHKGGREAWVNWMATVMREAYRVLKPGAHGLVWAIPRTSHWTATALEDAGFEVRDVVTHLFGSGFPKSLDISKAIDKAAGTDAAKQWQGWGTALKPASEHWILVRKPCSEKTVAANVLKHGTGGLNIDASRIGTEEILGRFNNAKPTKHRVSDSNANAKNLGRMQSEASFVDNSTGKGRFPANLILSHNADCVEVGTKTAGTGEMKKSGVRKSRENPVYGTPNTTRNSPDNYGTEIVAAWECSEGCAVRLLDEQTAGTRASRFFYVAKASKSDKGDGNSHPTVKSTALMTYLIRLITPPGGTVLDPFTGSGSTGVAARKCGFNFIGIEQDAQYHKIATARFQEALCPTSPKT